MSGTTLFCEPGCNPTYGHEEHCERFNPKDPRAKLRLKLNEAQERIDQEMSGGGSRERVEVSYRTVNDQPPPPLTAQPAVASHFAPTPPLPPAPPVSDLATLAREAFLRICESGPTQITPIRAREITHACAALISTIKLLEITDAGSTEEVTE